MFQRRLLPAKAQNGSAIVPVRTSDMAYCRQAVTSNAGGGKIYPMELHPIMYVPDQYLERSFYELFGFERHYEGEEFPGFLVVRHGSAIFGLQRASVDHPRYRVGLRWQFEVASATEIDEIISVCVANELTHDVIVEDGGDSFRTRLVTVRSPSDVVVWFEGPNEVS